MNRRNRHLMWLYRMLAARAEKRPKITPGAHRVPAGDFECRR